MAARLPIGLGLMGGGGFLMWGGLSGRLAPMLAAVFAPGLLEPAQSAGGGFPLLDINPARGGELVPPGSGPGIGEGNGPAPVAGDPPALGSGGPVIDVIPVP